MKKLVCTLQPFAQLQTVYIVSLEKEIETIRVPLQDIGITLTKIAVDNEIEEIYLKSSNDFALSIKEQIETVSALEYSAYKLNIKII